MGDVHRPGLIHGLGPIVLQLVVRDPLRVVDAPVQSHVETEGERAQGVGFHARRAGSAAAGFLRDHASKDVDRQGAVCRNGAHSKIGGDSMPEDDA